MTLHICYPLGWQVCPQQHLITEADGAARFSMRGGITTKVNTNWGKSERLVLLRHVERTYAGLLHICSRLSTRPRRNLGIRKPKIDVEKRLMAITIFDKLASAISQVVHVERRSASLLAQKGTNVGPPLRRLLASQKASTLYPNKNFVFILVL